MGGETVIVSPSRSDNSLGENLRVNVGVNVGVPVGIYVVVYVNLIKMLY